MQILKKLASDTAIYGLSSILGRILNYLLVPFYTSIFLPSEYGIITEFYAYAAFGSIVYTLGLETAYFRFAARDKASINFNIFTSLLLLASLLFSGCLVIFATPLISQVGYPGYERYIYYLAAILTVDTVLVMPFAQLRLRRQALFFASAKLFQIGLNILLNLLFLYPSKHISYSWLPPWLGASSKIDYVFIANLLANAAILPLFTRTWTKFSFQLPGQQLKPILQYAFPLLMMGLAGTANEMLSRVLLKYLLPPDFYPGQSNTAILGIFGACYKLSVFMSLAIQAFRYAAEPFFFTHAQDRHSPQLFSQIMQAYILAACFILLTITTNLDWLGYLFLRNPVYRSGLEIVPYLLLAYLWLGIYYNLSVWFKLTNQTYYGTWITGIGAIANGLVNPLLIPYFGYWGSIWATLASYVIMSLISYYYGQKHYPIPYQVGRGLLYILVTVCLIPLIRNIGALNWYTSFLINGGIMGLFGLLLYRWMHEK